MVERHQVRLALALRYWESGSLAIGITAVLCSLCTATDAPTPMTRTLTVWFVVAFPLSALYEFVILPAIDVFVSLGAIP